MSQTLESIMLDLKTGTDVNNHVTDTNLIKRALDGLEAFPMSMDQLQQTRVGSVLQSIRHHVDNSLKKRIKDIIRAWQQLLDPSTGGTIVPIQRKLKPPNSTAALVFSPSTDLRPSYNNSTNSAPTNGHVPKSLLPRILTAIGDVSNLSKATTPVIPRLPNGTSPKPPNGHITQFPEPPKLAKVKSTAELIAAAGGCIDSVTKDRILSNRIAKESDEFPHFVLQTSTRTPRRPKLQDNLANKFARVSAAAVASPQSRPPFNSQALPVISAAKSEIIAKFLESTAFEMLAPKKPDRVDHASPMPPTAPPLDAPKPKHHRHHKEKQTRKRKHSGGCDGKPHDNSKKAPDIPVTNRMDQWPQLPPITGEALAMAALQDEIYHSGETPKPEDLCDLGRVDLLIGGNWPEVSASRDDTNQLHSMTSLYSVDMGDDQLVHILPWTDLAGNRQSFFPSTAEADIDRLVDMPDPW